MVVSHISWEYQRLLRKGLNCCVQPISHIQDREVTAVAIRDKSLQNHSAT